MTDSLVSERTSIFKVGWSILMLIVAGNTLGQLGLLLFDPGGDTVFLAWAAFSFVTTAILLVPYRRGETWAWYVIWAAIVPYALVILFNQDVGPIYLGEAAMMAVGQILASGHFRTTA